MAGWNGYVIRMLVFPFILASDHVHLTTEAVSHTFVVCSILLNASSVPYDYRRTASAIELALEDVQTRYGEHLQLDYKYIDGGNLCKGNRVGAIAADLYTKYNISAFIGPGKSQV